MDGYSEETELSDPALHLADQQDLAIGIQDATFTWSSEQELEARRVGRRTFALQIRGALTFKHGAINIVVGPTGSGKTSLLMALLGEPLDHICDNPGYSLIN